MVPVDGRHFWSRQARGCARAIAVSLAAHGPGSAGSDAGMRPGRAENDPPVDVYLSHGLDRRAVPRSIDRRGATRCESAGADRCHRLVQPARRQDRDAYAWMYAGPGVGPGALSGMDMAELSTGIEIDTGGRLPPPGRPLSFPERMRVRFSVNVGRLWYGIIGGMRAAAIVLGPAGWF